MKTPLASTAMVARLRPRRRAALRRPSSGDGIDGIGAARLAAQPTEREREPADEQQARPRRRRRRARPSRRRPGCRGRRRLHTAPTMTLQERFFAPETACWHPPRPRKRAARARFGGTAGGWPATWRSSAMNTLPRMPMRRLTGCGLKVNSTPPTAPRQTVASARSTDLRVERWPRATPITDCRSAPAPRLRRERAAGPAACQTEREEEAGLIASLLQRKDEEQPGEHRRGDEQEEAES